jgi:prepilin-type N-terminal cleavage/methylation domain-containing protein
MKERAFTLIEVLVATAVLALILVMMLGVTNGILSSTRAQNQQMDSVASARRALDVLTSDIGAAVIGPSSSILLPSVASTNLLALVAQRRGPDSAGSPRFLAVRYSTNSDALYRSYDAVSFASTDFLNPAAGAATTTSTNPLAPGILAVRILEKGVVGTSATNTYAGFPVPVGWSALATPASPLGASVTNRTRALEIWVTAIDPQGLSLLTNSGQLATAKSLLGSDPTHWRAAIDASDLSSATKSALRVLNKTVSLP